MERPVSASSPAQAALHRLCLRVPAVEFSLVRGCVLASAIARVPADRDNLASDPILVDRVGRVSDPATSVGRGNQLIGRCARAIENSRRISPAEFATGTNGRIGVRIMATKFATTGEIMPAITTTGTAMNGGCTITFTFPTTEASIIGLGPLGRR